MPRADELPASFYYPQLFAHQQWLEELDPGHPSWQVLSEFGAFDQYMGTSDSKSAACFVVRECLSTAAAHSYRKRSM